MLLGEVHTLEVVHLLEKFVGFIKALDCLIEAILLVLHMTELEPLFEF